MLCHLHEFCQHDMLYSKKVYLNKKEGGGTKHCVWKIFYGLITETPAMTERCCINRQSINGNYLWDAFGNGLKDVTALKAVGELSFSNKKGKKYLFSNISDWILSF